MFIGRHNTKDFFFFFGRCACACARVLDCLSQIFLAFLHAFSLSWGLISVAFAAIDAAQLPNALRQHSMTVLLHTVERSGHSGKKQKMEKKE